MSSLHLLRFTLGLKTLLVFDKRLSWPEGQLSISEPQEASEAPTRSHSAS